MHEAGGPYVAYVHDIEGRPDAVVELALFSPGVGVYFLDDRRERSIDYAFKSDGAGGLFLDEFGWRSFGRRPDNHGRDPSLLTRRTVSVTRSGFSSREEKRWKRCWTTSPSSTSRCRLSGNYHSITRYER